MSIRTRLAVSTAWAIAVLVGCAAAPRADVTSEATRMMPPPGIQTRGLTNGWRAPEVTLTDTEGNLHTLGGPAAQERVVVFYRGAGAPQCRQQLAKLQSALKDFAALGAQVFAVSVDEVEASADLRKRLGLTYPVLVDHRCRACNAFGIHDARVDSAWPTTFVIDQQGRVTWRHIEPTYPERVPVTTLLSALEPVPPSP